MLSCPTNEVIHLEKDGKEIENGEEEERGDRYGMENDGIQDVEDGEGTDGSGVGDDVFGIEVKDIPGWEVLRLPRLPHVVVANGHPDFHQKGYLASGRCCIEELEGLSAQPAARLGNALDIFGVTTDIARTVDLLSSSSEDGPEGKHFWYWWSP